MNEKIKVKNVILRCGADSLLPLMLVYMLYIIFHGHLSPGGGFQGGVLMAAVVVMLYLGHGYETTTRVLSANLLHGTEGFASIFYVALAMLGVAVGFQFWLGLWNFFSVNNLVFFDESFIVPLFFCKITFKFVSKIAQILQSGIIVFPLKQINLISQIIRSVVLRCCRKKHNIRLRLN